MKEETIALLKSAYGINFSAISELEEAEKQLAPQFRKIEDVALHNQTKVLRAFQDERVELRHFAPSSGYGYDDIGRDTLDRVFARVVGAESALLRPQFASGTHAISMTLLGTLMPGEELLCISGKPYDTLEETLGIRGDAWGSLKHYGITYSQLDRLDNGDIDFDNIEKRINSKTKALYLQRSRGYSWRKALSLDDIKEGIERARSIKPDIVAIVDNCYGEFTDIVEPTELGADLIVGSMIKNPGGGIAPTGAYIAGKELWVERLANRMTAPGIGREVGSYAGSYTQFYQGLFLAPQVTASSLKGAVLAAKLFEMRGLETLPSSNMSRSDIIQAIRFNDREMLIKFCKIIQRSAPVDSHLSPEPWDMPGYEDPVIMAAGSFIQGASIELSADAPVREPYIAYMQGGLTYDHVKLALLIALSELI